MPVSGRARAPSLLDGMRQFSRKQDSEWLLPEPWLPQMKMLEGVVTLKNSPSLLEIFSSKVLELAPRRAYCENAGLLEFAGSDLAYFQTGRVKSGEDLISSRASSSGSRFRSGNSILSQSRMCLTRMSLQTY